VVVREAHPPHSSGVAQTHRVVRRAVAEARAALVVHGTAVLHVLDQQIDAFEVCLEIGGGPFLVLVVGEEDHLPASRHLLEPVSDGRLRVERLEHLDDQALREIELLMPPERHLASSCAEMLEHVNGQDLEPTLGVEEQNVVLRVLEVHGRVEVRGLQGDVTRVVRLGHQRPQHLLRADAVLLRADQRGSDARDVGHRTHEQALLVVVVHVGQEDDQVLRPGPQCIDAGHDVPASSVGYEPGV